MSSSDSNIQTNGREEACVQQSGLLTVHCRLCKRRRLPLQRGGPLQQLWRCLRQRERLGCQVLRQARRSCHITSLLPADAKQATTFQRLHRDCWPMLPSRQHAHTAITPARCKYQPSSPHRGIQQRLQQRVGAGIAFVAAVAEQVALLLQRGRRRPGAQPCFVQAATASAFIPVRQQQALWLTRNMLLQYKPCFAEQYTERMQSVSWTLPLNMLPENARPDEAS